MVRLLWAALALLVCGCQTPSGFVSSGNFSAPATANAVSGFETDAERILRVGNRVMQAAEAHCANAKPDPAPIDRGSCRFPIAIADSSAAFASSNTERVRVSTGFVRFVMSDAELAFVIAHETGHILRNHSVSVSSERRQEQELEADRIGVVLLARAGYDPRAAASLLQRMTNSGLFAQSDPSHPALAYRTRVLRDAMNRTEPAAVE
jgi:Zn-dependent protease with chaperone function